MIDVIKDTEFLSEVKKLNEDNFIEKDSFLKDVFKNKDDYIEKTLYGSEEQIKVALVIVLDQLAHIKNDFNYKKDVLEKGLKKRTDDEYPYSNESVINTLKTKSEDWYDRKKASDDERNLKNVFELSGARKNDENIKNKDLLEFNEALNSYEIKKIVYNIKKLVMIECIKDRRINKAIYTNENVYNNGEKYIRIAFNTNDQYMLVMAHLKEENFRNISIKHRKYIKEIQNIPWQLSTSFPIFLNDYEWSLESNYNDVENNYKTKYRRIKNDFEKYDKIYEQEKEEKNGY